MVKKAVIVGLLLVVTFTGEGLGREIVVTSTADSGTGSFRWALQTARSNRSYSRCGANCGGCHNDSDSVGEDPARGDIQ